MQEWELLLASPTAGAAVSGPYAGGGGEGHDDVDAGAIKYDYFDLGSDARYTRRASLSIGGEEETDEEDALLDASGNASWVEPQPDDLAFPGRDRAALWSDSSSDGERREEAEATEPLEPPPPQEAAPAPADEGAVAKGGAAPWWKLPMEVLRLWASRAARSAWSLPVAVALLGIAVLGRRLYRMRRQSKAVARFRLVLDEKKASQFKAQPMLRRAPIVKPLLPANGVTPWPVLGHL